MRGELEAKMKQNITLTTLKRKRTEDIKATGLIHMKRGREWAEELKDFVYCI